MAEDQKTKYKVVVEIESDLSDNLSWEEAEMAARGLHGILKVTFTVNGIPARVRTHLLEKPGPNEAPVKKSVDSSLN